MLYIDAYDFLKKVISYSDLDTVNGHESGKYHLIVENHDAERRDNKYKIIHSDTAFDLWLNKIHKDGRTLRFSPASYCGSKPMEKNVRMRLGFIISLTTDKEGNAEKVFNRIFNKNTIQPTFIFNRGKNQYLVFLFDTPVPAFSRYSKQIDHTAKYIASLLTIKTDDGQYRHIGKVVTESVAIPAHDICFCAEPVSIQRLNETFMSNCPITYVPNNGLSSEDAKEKYPKWYNRVVTQEKEAKTGFRCFVADKSLYRWWLKKAESAPKNKTNGAAQVICIYGVKCNVPERQIRNDIENYLFGAGYDYQSVLDKTDGIITEYYNETVRKYTRRHISEMSGIDIKENKRNYNTLEEHLRLLHENNKKKLKEDPTLCGSKVLIIKEWRTSHPKGKVSLCVLQTGLSRSTVYRWWKICLGEKVSAKRRRLSKKERAAKRRAKETFCRRCGAYVNLFHARTQKVLQMFNRNGQTEEKYVRKRLCPLCEAAVSSSIA